MSVELSILRAFCDSRAKHLMHVGHVDAKKELPKELKTLFNLVTKYYEENEDQNHISRDTLKTYYELKYPKDNKKDDIDTLVDIAFELDVNEGMVGELLDQMHERHAANIMVNQLMPVVEGHKFGVLADLQPQLDEFIDGMHHPPESLSVPVPLNQDFDEVMEEALKDHGLTWRINSITDALSRLKPCTLGLVYAYVDSGKTSFMLDNVAHWSDQLEENEKIAYCGNEEMHKRLSQRTIQAYLKQPLEWIKENYEEAKRIVTYETNWPKLLFFKDITEGFQLNYVIKTYRPKIVVIDQATYVNIKAKRRAEGVNYLEQLFQWYRRLANRYEIAIVGVAQANALEPKNAKWLTLQDIYNSNVSIQGALDYALGIGRDVKDPAAENLRYAHVTKSKFVPDGQKRLTLLFRKGNCLWEPA